MNQHLLDDGLVVVLYLVVMSVIGLVVGLALGRLV